MIASRHAQWEDTTHWRIHTQKVVRWSISIYRRGSTWFKGFPRHCLFSNRQRQGKGEIGNAKREKCRHMARQREEWRMSFPSPSPPHFLVSHIQTSHLNKHIAQASVLVHLFHSRLQGWRVNQIFSTFLFLLTDSFNSLSLSLSLCSTLQVYSLMKSTSRGPEAPVRDLYCIIATWYASVAIARH